MDGKPPKRPEKAPNPYGAADSDHLSNRLVANPYQPPAQPSETIDATEGAIAEFQLTRNQIRFAESKYLLFRCGVRLTIASLIMIAIAVLVAVQPAVFPLGQVAFGPANLSLVGRQLIVMALATVIYLSLIHQVRRSLRKNLAEQGVIDGAGISVKVLHDQIEWSSPNGVYCISLDKAYLMKTGRGVIIAMRDNRFWFVPKDALFNGPGYRHFVMYLANAITDFIMSQSSPQRPQP